MNTPKYHRLIHSCSIFFFTKCVQNERCCGIQLSGSRIERLSGCVGRNNGLISMYEDLGTLMNGLVLGFASASLTIVARRGLGKLRHLDTHYLWIQEKAVKGDLDFKRVADVDTGADLFTKTLSWNEIQSDIQMWSLQFAQNEISVNYVGVRQNGVNLRTGDEYCWRQTSQRGLEQT